MKAILALLALVPALVCAQATFSSTVEKPPAELKLFGPFLGRFEGTFAFSDAALRSMVGPAAAAKLSPRAISEFKKTRVPVRVQFSTAMNGHFVQMDIAYGPPKSGVESRTMIAFDKTAKRIRAWQLMPVSEHDSLYEIEDEGIEIAKDSVTMVTGNDGTMTEKAGATDQRVKIVKSGTGLHFRMESKIGGIWTTYMEAKLKPKAR